MEENISRRSLLGFGAAAVVLAAAPALALGPDMAEAKKPLSGGRIVYSGSEMRVYDHNDVLRVRLGFW